MSEYHYVTIGGREVLQPAAIRQFCRVRRFPCDWWERANSITVSAGPDPDTAYLLVSRATAEALDPAALHEIKWTYKQEGVASVRQFTFGNWVLWRAVALTGNGDGNAPYLLELRDKRELMGLGEEIDADYNITLGWKSSAKLYQTSTTNSGTPWTWQGLLNTLWSSLPSAIRGTAPTLSYTPTHTPEHFQFSGTAWQAVTEVLAACQSTVVPCVGGFRLVCFGDSQTGLSSYQSALSHRLLWDGRPLYSRERQLVPEKVRVYTVQRTLEPDADQTNREEVATGLADATTGYFLELFSDLIHEGTSTNGAAVTTSGSSLAARAALIYSAPALDQWYGGVRCDVAASPAEPFSVGPRLHRIRVRDYGDGAGLITEISTLPRYMLPQSVRHPLLVRPWIRKGAVDEASGIASGATGTIDVWLNGGDTGVDVEASNDWMQGAGVALADNDEVIIGWFRDEASGAGKWTILGVEC